MSVKSLSQKNRYWLEENRYRELKYYCLQYPEWKRAYEGLSSLTQQPELYLPQPDYHGDPTAKCAIAMDKYNRKMAVVDRAAEKTDLELKDYILKGVTEGLSYDQLVARMGMPCGRKLYYNYYHKFFWTLSKMKE